MEILWYENIVNQIVDGNFATWCNLWWQTKLQCL